MKVQHVSRRLRRFIRTNEAVSALEYAVLVGVVVVAVGAALITFTGEIEDAIESIADEVEQTADSLEDTDLSPDG